MTQHWNQISHQQKRRLINGSASSSSVGNYPLVPAQMSVASATLVADRGEEVQFCSCTCAGVCLSSLFSIILIAWLAYCACHKKLSTGAREVSAFIIFGSYRSYCDPKAYQP